MAFDIINLGFKHCIKVTCTEYMARKGFERTGKRLNQRKGKKRQLSKNLWKSYQQRNATGGRNELGSDTETLNSIMWKSLMIFLRDTWDWYRRLTEMVLTVWEEKKQGLPSP